MAGVVTVGGCLITDRGLPISHPFRWFQGTNAVENDGKAYAKDTIQIRTVTDVETKELIVIVSHCRKSSIPTGIFKNHDTAKQAQNKQRK